MDGHELLGTRAFVNPPSCVVMTPCRLMVFKTKPMPGAFIPTCNDDGTFAMTQCHESTGHCWCVNTAGFEVEGTRMRGTPSCETLDIPDALTSCEEWTARVPSLLGAYRPQCDEEGEFLPRQCHGSTGHCWCVDNKGNELLGTRLRAPRRPKCSKVSQCQLMRDGQLDTALTAFSSVRLAVTPSSPGRHRPLCSSDGEYSPVQCHASTGYCWCVDMDGKELRDSRVRFVVPECEKMTPCLLSVFNSQSAPGEFTPSCEDDGSFSRMQCHASTGHCWCVDHKGSELADTRVRGDPDCDNIDIPPPQTLCQELANSPRSGRHGAYRPQCDSVTGEFVPSQFHASTGMSWCVDTSGNEIEGTRVRAPEVAKGCARVTPCQLDGHN